jgi:hypothetical protein
MHGVAPRYFSIGKASNALYDLYCVGRCKNPATKKAQIIGFMCAEAFEIMLNFTENN